jgi:hypothetical protein
METQCVFFKVEIWIFMYYLDDCHIYEGYAYSYEADIAEVCYVNISFD